MDVGLQSLNQRYATLWFDGTLASNGEDGAAFIPTLLPRSLVYFALRGWYSGLQHYMTNNNNNNTIYNINSASLTTEITDFGWTGLFSVEFSVFFWWRKQRQWLNKRHCCAVCFSMFHCVYNFLIFSNNYKYSTVVHIPYSVVMCVYVNCLIVKHLT